jgi:membrane associated rhomboid family serine protease/Flp pilus assembly protein TadD
MALQRCITCGKEFERRFGDSALTVKCPTCDLQQFEANQAPLFQTADAADAATFPVTITLIFINVLMLAVMVFRGVSLWAPTPQQAIAFGADFGPLTLGGQWWRLFTSMFVHFGIVHLGLNMWCLWNLGRAAERLLGRFPYLLAYLASGLFGSIASVYWHPLAAGAGASGAIFGLAGVLVSFVYLKKTPAHLQINSKMLGSLGTFIFYNLIYGAAIPGISNAAHLGGLMMGLAVGALLPSAAAAESARRTRLSVAVMLITLTLLASAVATKRLRATVGELASIQQLIHEGKNDQALAKLQELTSRDPNLAPAQAMLAAVYFGKGQPSDGLLALQKACAADPHNASYQLQLGSAYVSLGQFDQAIVPYHTVVRQNPQDPRGFMGLGYAYLGMKQYDSAISEFREAATLDPKSPAAQHGLGRAQLLAGRFADAQATYRRLLTQNPNDPRAQAGLDSATRQLGSPAPLGSAPAPDFPRASVSTS